MELMQEFCPHEANPYTEYDINVADLENSDDGSDYEEDDDNEDYDDDEDDEIPVTDVRHYLDGGDSRPEDLKELASIKTFIEETCNCQLGPQKTPCSATYSVEDYIQSRADAFELESDQLDFFLMGMIQGSTENAGGKSMRTIYKSVYFNFLSVT